VLGLSLGRISINRNEASGKAEVVWPEARDPRAELLVLAAARICMRAFDIETLHDEGGWADEIGIQNIMEDILPDGCKEDRINYIRIVDDELSKIFERDDVRAAAMALAEMLTHTGEIGGYQAEVIIDRHLNKSATSRWLGARLLDSAEAPSLCDATPTEDDRRTSSRLVDGVGVDALTQIPAWPCTSHLP
jgi:hypothetical protein